MDDEAGVDQQFPAVGSTDCMRMGMPAEATVCLEQGHPMRAAKRVCGSQTGHAGSHDCH